MNRPLTSQGFEGTIGRTLADSEPHFEIPPHPGADSPNVVVVLLDDTGFAQFGCFGSDIDTPNVDALAANGLQYTIWATGSASSGISIFVQNDKLFIDYNSFDERTVLESELPVPQGDSVLGASLARSSRTTGTMSLTIDGKPAGSVDLPFMMRMISSLGASVGMDFGSQVSLHYDDTFPFDGTLHQVEIQLGQRFRKDTEAAAKSEMSRQ